MAQLNAAFAHAMAEVWLAFGGGRSVTTTISDVELIGDSVVIGGYYAQEYEYDGTWWEPIREGDSVIEIGAGWFALIVLCSFLAGVAVIVALAIGMSKRKRRKRSDAAMARYPQNASNDDA